MRRIIFVLTCLLLILNIPVLAEKPEVEYFALYLNESRCGYAVESRQIDGEKVITSNRMYLELKRMETPIKMEVIETAVETLSGRPLGFQFVQKAAMNEMIIKGSVRPDGIMKIEVQNAGNKQTVERAYPEGAIMAEGMKKLIEGKRLEKGTSYSANVFSPSILQAFKITFNVGEAGNVDLLGRVVELVEIKGDYILPDSGKVSYTTYVDREYNAQKMIMPVAGMKIVMIACSESFAKSNLEAAEVLSSMIMKSPVAIRNVEKAKEIVYTLRPKNPDSPLSFPVTDLQHVEILEDGRFVVKVRHLQGDMKAVYPYKGNDQEIISFLGQSPYIQSSHPEIIKLARECVKDKKYALDAALAIEAFVGDYIDNKSLSVGYASALEVARSRQGDCTEHALLTAALCRAAGIPARIVMGVAYVNNFQNMMNCFGAHAWTEAYVGDKWIGLDAAFRNGDRSGFDAGHIAMATGSGEPGDFFGMVGTIGFFEIEKMEISK